MTAPLTITDPDGDSVVFEGRCLRVLRGSTVLLEDEALRAIRAWIDAALVEPQRPGGILNPSHEAEHAEGRRLAALDRALMGLTSVPPETIVERARTFEDYLAGGASE